MYGNEVVNSCIKLLEGEDMYYGLQSPGVSFDGFTAHNKLLEGYAKLHKAKQENWVSE